MTTFWKPVHFDMFQTIFDLQFRLVVESFIGSVMGSALVSVMGSVMGKVLGSVSTCHESMTCLLELLIWLILHVSLCRVCSLKYVSSCMLQMLSMRVQRHLHCALSSKKIQCNMQSLTSEPLVLCETHRLRCSITINIKTLISYCTISNCFFFYHRRWSSTQLGWR